MKSIIIQLVAITVILSVATYQSVSITNAALEQQRQMNEKVIERIEQSELNTKY